MPASLQAAKRRHKTACRRRGGTRRCVLGRSAPGRREASRRGRDRLGTRQRLAAHRVGSRELRPWGRAATRLRRPARRSHRVDKLEPGSRLHRGLKVGRGGDKSPQSPRDAGQQSRWDVANPQHTPRPVACAAGGQSCRLCLAEDPRSSGSRAVPASVRPTLRCVRSNSRTPSSSSSLRTCSETAG